MKKIRIVTKVQSCRASVSRNGRGSLTLLLDGTRAKGKSLGVVTLPIRRKDAEKLMSGDQIGDAEYVIGEYCFASGGLIYNLAFYARDRRNLCAPNISAFHKRDAGKDVPNCIILAHIARYPRE